jgi:hypothetical protein
MVPRRLELHQLFKLARPPETLEHGDNLQGELQGHRPVTLAPAFDLNRQHAQVSGEVGLADNLHTIVVLDRRDDLEKWGGLVSESIAHA